MDVPKQTLRLVDAFIAKPQVASQADARQQQQAAQAEAERNRAATATAVASADEQLQQAQREKKELRAQLLLQFNTILETRDTARGLIVNMSDVLFDTGKHALRPVAREKLAKISGIMLAYPGLKLGIEGNTDSVGGDAYNQGLSERRAESVRSYLAEQGIPGSSMTATGFGKTQPIATNDTRRRPSAESTGRVGSIWRSDRNHDR